MSQIRICDGCGGRYASAYLQTHRRRHCHGPANQGEADGEEEEEVVNSDEEEEEEEEHVDEVLAVEWRFHRSATNCSKMSTDGAVMVALPDNYLFP